MQPTATSRALVSKKGMELTLADSDIRETPDVESSPIQPVTISTTILLRVEGNLHLLLFEKASNHANRAAINIAID